MNIGQLLNSIGGFLPFLGGAALYAVGHLRGTKAAAKAAPDIAALETKAANALGVANNALAVATAAKTISDGHALQLPAINNALGVAQGKAETALSFAAGKALPPELSGMASAVIDPLIESARRSIENMTTRAIQTVSDTPLNVNVSRGLTVGELAKAAPVAAPPAEEAKPGPLAQVASALGLGGGATT